MKKVSNNLRGEIYNNVDYDYPTCGGIIITAGSKYLTINRESNYQGNVSGSYARLPIDSVTAQSIIKEIDDDELDLDYLQTLDYRGGHVIQ